MSEYVQEPYLSADIYINGDTSRVNIHRKDYGGMEKRIMQAVAGVDQKDWKPNRTEDGSFVVNGIVFDEARVRKAIVTCSIQSPNEGEGCSESERIILAIIEDWLGRAK